MGKILCATRGGEASYRTRDAAIALAQERGDELLFLYVVDIGFLSKMARAVRPDVVATQMEKMGEFMLDMTRQRAQKQGVEAGFVLRHGDLREELKAAVHEQDVTMVVLGRPAGTASFFVLSGKANSETALPGGRRAGLESLHAFAVEIQAETGAQVNVL